MSISQDIVRKAHLFVGRLAEQIEGSLFDLQPLFFLPDRTKRAATRSAGRGDRCGGRHLLSRLDVERPRRRILFFPYMLDKGSGGQIDMVMLGGPVGKDDSTGALDQRSKLGKTEYRCCTIASVVTVYRKTGLPSLIAETFQDLDVGSCIKLTSAFQRQLKKVRPSHQRKL